MPGLSEILCVRRLGEFGFRLIDMLSSGPCQAAGGCPG